MSQSLERGLQALLFLSSRKSIGVTELAEELHKSTAFRILETLQRYNMAEQNKNTAKYKLGPAILKFSEQLYKNLNIISVAKPYMYKLADEVGESVHLTVLSNDSAVVIEQIMTNSRLQVNARLGNAEPLNSSSVGKCLLAFSPSELTEKILKRMAYPRFTEKTITDENELRKELEKIKKDGYAVDDGEISEEIKCVAAPIFNHTGEVIYSIGISGPYYRMKEDKMKTVITKLMRTSAMISEEMGFSGGYYESND